MALALLPTSAAWATAGARTPSPTHTVTGTATTAIGKLSVAAKVPVRGPDRATGSFSATGNPVPGTLGGLPSQATRLASFHFAGPVTCMHVQAGHVGLIYPIKEATGPVASSFKGQAIYITIEDNGPGAPEQVGFFGPAPLSSLTSCPALTPFLTVTSGHIAVDGR